MADEETYEEEKETVYDEEGREEMVEDDGMSGGEEGFMKGYEEADSEETDKEETTKEEEEEKEK